MFSKVLIEKDILDHPNAQKILSNLKNQEPIIIDDFQNYWGKVKKPYLQKRENLNLFIAKKKGQLIKQTPDAYGSGKAPHFYFIHAYNCIYECEYCFLQGYFNTPDMVFFVNHEDIIKEMEEITKIHPEAWFHAGEFSDSLALNHITDELDLYWDFFEKHPQAKLELRTKSVNIKNVLKLRPLENTLVTFSLSPQNISKEFDLKTPSTKARINALSKLSDSGFQLGIHLDPMIYSSSFKDEYEELINNLLENVKKEQIQYVSLGVVRYTKDVYKEVRNNYPDSNLHAGPYIKSFDEKIRYSKPTRNWMFNTVKDLLLSSGIKEEKIYLCME